MIYSLANNDISALTLISDYKYDPLKRFRAYTVQSVDQTDATYLNNKTSNQNQCGDFFLVVCPR